jgi:hypothetical protein
MNMTRKELIAACKTAAKNCNKAINESAKSEALKIREQSKDMMTIIRNAQAKAIARIRAETAELLAAERAQAKFKIAEVKGYKEQRKNQVKLFTGLFDTESIVRLTEAVEFTGVVEAKTIEDMQAEFRAKQPIYFTEGPMYVSTDPARSARSACSRVVLPAEVIEESNQHEIVSSNAETEDEEDEDDWSFEWTDQQLRTHVVLDDPRGVFSTSDNVFMHRVDENGWFDLSCNDRLRLIGLTLYQYEHLDYDRKQEVDNIVEDHRAPKMSDLTRSGFTYLCEFED